MRGAVMVFSLVCLGMVASDGAAWAKPRAAKPEPEAASASQASARAGDVPGRYTVLRNGKDTGCMLTLETGRAQLAPACRDNGLVIFDPKGWAVSGGKLMLKARKGHSAAFEMDKEGVWQKDSKAGGAPLALKKM